MHPILFKVGPFTVYSLGVLWALAALCAGWVARLELKRYRFNLQGALRKVREIG